MHTPITCAVALAALGLAHAQFTDLQPGRNYPFADTLPGSEYSESVDFGDVDSDGDLDIVIGNGGDIGAQPNRIFVNLGGLQGGTEGTFLDDTAVRFAGLVDGSTRDLDFGDIDGDGDLDLVEANRGTNFTGEVARILVNQGGAQGGTLGVFVDASDTAWGALLTVPPGDQVFGGDQGPWRGWSCDCDFADLDADGDLDLFASSYGPDISGSRPSRVFLNDGSGVFDEHAPWADAGADIEWHSLAVELVDLDGDMDLDLFASSRESQSRVFVNNTFDPLPGATTLFTDTTLESLVTTGATASGMAVYDAEPADFDGDGDYDIWAINYAGFADRRLTNRGNAPGEPPEFDVETAAFGDPSIDENEIDHLDFDGDGDLDAFAANFAGTNWLHANGLAQGVEGFHRTGTTSGASLYPDPETPAASNGHRTRDADVGDLDGDGDTDIVLANDLGQQNRLWLNELGVPDTHAPTVARVTSPPSGALSGAFVVHTSLRDNDALYNVARSDVDLLVRIDGGPEQSRAMTSSGAGIFRSVVDLGAVATSLEYRVRAVDAAGNVGVSDTFFAPVSWTDLGGGLAGVDGIPALVALGTLSPGATGTLSLTEAAPSASALLALSAPTAGVPFKGGTLLAVPFDLAISLTTSPAGTLALPYAIPGNAPSGIAFHLQLLVADPAAIKGVALSNALRGDVP